MSVVPRHCGDDAEDKTWHVAYYRLATSLIIKLFFTVHFYNTCFVVYVFFFFFFFFFLFFVFCFLFLLYGSVLG